MSNGQFAEFMLALYLFFGLAVFVVFVLSQIVELWKLRQEKKRVRGITEEYEHWKADQE